MILVDTSIWIDHLHQGDPVMFDLLENNVVMMHSFVFGEIALGSLKRRHELLADLATIPVAPVARDDEVFELIERNKLFGTGIGFVDAHLLASTLLGDEHLLWTRDRRLAAAAEKLGIDANAA
jgi:predicted nucleic acid-binding protein